MAFNVAPSARCQRQYHHHERGAATIVPRHGQRRWSCCLDTINAATVDAGTTCVATASADTVSTTSVSAAASAATVKAVTTRAATVSAATQSTPPLRVS